MGPTDRDLAEELVLPYLEDAVQLVLSGYAKTHTVDTAMRLGAGHPRGPFELMDEMGRDRPDHSDPPDPPPPELEAPVERLGVVGTGVVGSGIVETAARAGFGVVCWGRSEESCRRGGDAVTDSLASSVERGKLSREDADAALARIDWTTDLHLGSVDIVVEAVTEDLEVKTSIFRDLDQATEPSTVLATATSSLSVTALADETERPDRVLGLHFFNPVPVMRLVEVVKTLDTADAAVAVGMGLARQMDKEPIVCGDRAGFIVNRLLFPYLNDAVRLLESGAASSKEIDDAVTTRFEHPMGPLALLDLVGLDVALQILRSLHDAFGDPRMAPAPLFERKVREGALGRKSDEGLTG